MHVHTRILQKVWENTHRKLLLSRDGCIYWSKSTRGDAQACKLYWGCHYSEEHWYADVRVTQAHTATHTHTNGHSNSQNGQIDHNCVQSQCRRECGRCFSALWPATQTQARHNKHLTIQSGYRDCTYQQTTCQKRATERHNSLDDCSQR